MRSAVQNYRETQRSQEGARRTSLPKPNVTGQPNERFAQRKQHTPADSKPTAPLHTLKTDRPLSTDNAPGLGPSDPSNVGNKPWSNDLRGLRKTAAVDTAHGAPRLSYRNSKPHTPQDLPLHLPEKQVRNPKQRDRKTYEREKEPPSPSQHNRISLRITSPRDLSEGQYTHRHLTVSVSRSRSPSPTARRKQQLLSEVHTDTDSPERSVYRSPHNHTYTSADCVSSHTPPTHSPHANNEEPIYIVLPGALEDGIKRQAKATHSHARRQADSHSTRRRRGRRRERGHHPVSSRSVSSGAFHSRAVDAFWEDVGPIPSLTYLSLRLGDNGELPRDTTQTETEVPIAPPIPKIEEVPPESPSKRKTLVAGSLPPHPSEKQRKKVIKGTGARDTQRAGEEEGERSVREDREKLPCKRSATSPSLKSPCPLSGSEALQSPGGPLASQPVRVTPSPSSVPLSSSLPPNLKLAFDPPPPQTVEEAERELREEFLTPLSTARDHNPLNAEKEKEKERARPPPAPFPVTTEEGIPLSLHTHPPPHAPFPPRARSLSVGRIMRLDSSSLSSSSHVLCPLSSLPQRRHFSTGNAPPLLVPFECQEGDRGPLHPHTAGDAGAPSDPFARIPAFASLLAAARVSPPKDKEQGSSKQKETDIGVSKSKPEDKDRDQQEEKGKGRPLTAEKSVAEDCETGTERQKESKKEKPTQAPTPRPPAEAEETDLQALSRKVGLLHDLIGRLFQAEGEGGDSADASLQMVAQTGGPDSPDGSKAPSASLLGALSQGLRLPLQKPCRGRQMEAPTDATPSMSVRGNEGMMEVIGTSPLSGEVQGKERDEPREGQRLSADSTLPPVSPYLPGLLSPAEAQGLGDAEGGASASASAASAGGSSSLMRARGGPFASPASFPLGVFSREEEELFISGTDGERDRERERRAFPGLQGSFQTAQSPSPSPSLSGQKSASSSSSPKAQKGRDAQKGRVRDGSASLSTPRKEAGGEGDKRATSPESPLLQALTAPSRDRSRGRGDCSDATAPLSVSVGVSAHNTLKNTTSANFCSQQQTLPGHFQGGQLEVMERERETETEGEQQASLVQIQKEMGDESGREGNSLGGHSLSGATKQKGSGPSPSQSPRPFDSGPHAPLPKLTPPESPAGGVVGGIQERSEDREGRGRSLSPSPKTQSRRNPGKGTSPSPSANGTNDAAGGGGGRECESEGDGSGWGPGGDRGAVRRTGAGPSNGTQKASQQTRRTQKGKDGKGDPGVLGADDAEAEDRGSYDDRSDIEWLEALIGAEEAEDDSEEGEIEEEIEGEEEEGLHDTDEAPTLPPPSLVGRPSPSSSNEDRERDRDGDRVRRRDKERGIRERDSEGIVKPSSPTRGKGEEGRGGPKGSGEDPGFLSNHSTEGSADRVLGKGREKKDKGPSRWERGEKLVAQMKSAQERRLSALGLLSKDRKKEGRGAGKKKGKKKKKLQKEKGEDDLMVSKTNEATEGPDGPQRSSAAALPQTRGRRSNRPSGGGQPSSSSSSSSSSSFFSDHSFGSDEDGSDQGQVDDFSTHSENQTRSGASSVVSPLPSPDAMVSQHNDCDKWDDPPGSLPDEDHSLSLLPAPAAAGVSGDNPYPSSSPSMVKGRTDVHTGNARRNLPQQAEREPESHPNRRQRDRDSKGARDGDGSITKPANRKKCQCPYCGSAAGSSPSPNPFNSSPFPHPVTAPPGDASVSPNASRPPPHTQQKPSAVSPTPSQANHPTAHPETRAGFPPRVSASHSHSPKDHPGTTIKKDKEDEEELPAAPPCPHPTPSSCAVITQTHTQNVQSGTTPLPNPSTISSTLQTLLKQVENESAAIEQKKHRQPLPLQPGERHSGPLPLQTAVWGGGADNDQHHQPGASDSPCRLLESFPVPAEKSIPFREGVPPVHAQQAPLPKSRSVSAAQSTRPGRHLGAAPSTLLMRTAPAALPDQSRKGEETLSSKTQSMIEDWRHFILHHGHHPRFRRYMRNVQLRSKRTPPASAARRDQAQSQAGGLSLFSLQTAERGRGREQAGEAVEGRSGSRSLSLSFTPGGCVWTTQEGAQQLQQTVEPGSHTMLPGPSAPVPSTVLPGSFSTPQQRTAPSPPSAVLQNPDPALCSLNTGGFPSVSVSTPPSPVLRMVSHGSVRLHAATGGPTRQNFAQSSNPFAPQTTHTSTGPGCEGQCPVHSIAPTRQPPLTSAINRLGLTAEPPHLLSPPRSPAARPPSPVREDLRLIQMSRSGGAPVHHNDAIATQRPAPEPSRLHPPQSALKYPPPVALSFPSEVTGSPPRNRQPFSHTRSRSRDRDRQRTPPGRPPMPFSAAPPQFPPRVSGASYTPGREREAPSRSRSRTPRPPGAGGRERSSGTRGGTGNNNKALIRTALCRGCLPGEINRKERTRVMAALESSSLKPLDSLLILLKGSLQDFDVHTASLSLGSPFPLRPEDPLSPHPPQCLPHGPTMGARRGATDGRFDFRGLYFFDRDTDTYRL
eukprot:Cvel_15550.t1-p1 / transcript=Cvel_15550.t1 / gene=Cvel_15550 / organism=Chromera_velia_CCMP2878 / gene_product=hypothetical protein / transcript_product=hypothetical protein / location=Cvel_scaffold1155:46651-55032(+) / protein_length=2475 / sequence_SO=supercontig / SO=protein_coding / is_pseudo=false